MKRCKASELTAGMWVLPATVFDDLTRAGRNPWKQSTVAREVIHNPVGCPGKAHVIAADGRTECWDHVTAVVVG